MQNLAFVMFCVPFIKMLLQAVLLVRQSKKEEILPEM